MQYSRHSTEGVGNANIQAKLSFTIPSGTYKARIHFQQYYDRDYDLIRSVKATYVVKYPDTEWSKWHLGQTFNVYLKNTM